MNKTVELDNSKLPPAARNGGLQDAVRIAESYCADVPEHVDVTLDKNSFAAGYLAAAGGIKQALTRLQDRNKGRSNEMADTGWTKQFPTMEGDYFSRIDEDDKSPTPIRIQQYPNGSLAVFEFGCDDSFQREHATESYEYLGPFTASDFEQLTKLREAAAYSVDVLDLAEAAMTAAAPYCARDLEIAIKERVLKVKSAITALREALAQRNTGGK